MLIGVKKRFLFIANSKTASTSIESALMNHAEIHRGGAPWRKHILMREALREYDFLFSQPGYRPDQFFKFGVMRDPVDWIYSWFRYRKGNTVADQLPPEMTFEQFWAKDDWNKWRASGVPRLQSDFFTYPRGWTIADYIIPYDEVDQHFPKICKHLGIKAALPRANVSAISGSPHDLSPAILDDVRAFYQADYALMERLPDLNRQGLARFGWA